MTDLIAHVCQDRELITERLQVLREAGLDERFDAFRLLQVALTRQLTAEKRELFPVLRRLDHGGDLVRWSRHNQARLERQIVRMTRLHVHSEDFLEEIDNLAKLLEERERHLTEDVPEQLRHACNGAELDALGDRYESAKQWAPSRAHPHLGGTNMGARLFAPLAAAIDTTRDFLRRNVEGSHGRDRSKGDRRSGEQP